MGERLYPIVFMIVASIVFTAAVSGVQVVLKDRIEANRQIAFQKALLDVAHIRYDPAWPPQKIVALYGERVHGETWGQVKLYVARDDAGQTCYLFRIGGRGFWGPIQGLLALESDLERIRGIAFTDHGETPGLGARISEDPWFASQFPGKRIDRSGAGPYFSIVLGGAQGEHQVDAITGATQTSMAVNRFLNEDLAEIVKAIQARRPTAEAAASGAPPRSAESH